MKLIYRPVILFVVLTLCLSAEAQVNIGGLPASFSKDLPAPDPVILPQPDRDRLEREDRQYPAPRFAAPIAADFSVYEDFSLQELPNGDRIWRLALRAPAALGLAFFYDECYLPPGATLYMYSPDRRQVKGGYTERNNPANGRFWTGLISGETAVVEYYEPKAVRGEGRLHLHRVDYAYNEALWNQRTDRLKSNFGFDASLDCHVNAECPEADSLEDQKQSVCRIIVVVEEGMGYCSGALMNNTDEDGAPYLLSAFHCQDGFTPLWDLYRFDFNYRGADCDNPVSEPGFTSVLGSELRAGRQENDFILLEITEPLPGSMGAYFSGWNRDQTAPDRGYAIHHPRGDIQKFSMDTAGIIIFPGPIEWNNDVTTPSGHHFRLNYDLGTFEVGSSGGPLYDQDKRVVGQLHGGAGSDPCDPSSVYFGRLSLAWEGGGTPDTRLRDWLDPANTGAMMLDGMAQDSVGELSLSGRVLTESASPVSNVIVTLNDGTVVRADTTGVDGQFAFPNLLPGDYTLQFEKEDDDQNGVTILDVIRIQKDILGITALDSPYKVFSADVNLSATVTTFDIIRIQKVILGIDEDFDPDTPHWKFFDAAYTFGNPDDPLIDGVDNTWQIDDLTTDLILDVVGIKTGDVNDSADPGN